MENDSASHLLFSPVGMIVPAPGLHYNREIAPVTTPNRFLRYFLELLLRIIKYVRG